MEWAQNAWSQEGNVRVKCWRLDDILIQLEAFAYRKKDWCLLSSAQINISETQASGRNPGHLEWEMLEAACTALNLQLRSHPCKLQSKFFCPWLWSLWCLNVKWPQNVVVKSSDSGARLPKCVRPGPSFITHWCWDSVSTSLSLSFFTFKYMETKTVPNSRLLGRWNEFIYTSHSAKCLIIIDGKVLPQIPSSTSPRQGIHLADVVLTMGQMSW